MAKTFGSQSLKKHGRWEDDWKDWMEGLPLISFKETKQLTLRPITPMLMMARHWPRSLQSGKNCPPIWCPKFDSLTQKFESDCPCHLHDDFGDRWKAQKVVILGAIVREWQDEKKNPTGFVVLPATTTAALVQIVGINKYDVADPAKGCDLSVVNNKEAQPANQWSIQRVERTPLSEVELKYRIPDLSKVSPDWEDKKFLAEFTKAMKKKLAMFSYYVSPKPEGGEGWAGYKKDAEGTPYTDFPELAELVGDGKSNDTEPKRKKRRDEEDDDRPAKKRRDEEDEPRAGKLQRHHDVVDEDDEEAPPAKKTKPKPPPDDDEDVAAAADEDSESAEDTPPPAKKKKPVDKDAEDESPPFDVDGEEAPAEKPVSKKIKPPKGAEEWSADPNRDGSLPAMIWKIGEGGAPVPKCYGVFAGAKKCKGCPVRTACMAADSEE